MRVQSDIKHQRPPIMVQRIIFQKYTRLTTLVDTLYQQMAIRKKKNISERVYFQLRYNEGNLPFQIQDTTDHLRKTESMNPLPSETLLVILDINSLYTNIPHGDGLQSCKEIWYSSNMLQAYTECLVKLLILVRKCNKFTSNVEHHFYT